MKRLTGIVVSTSMNNTIVAKVDWLWQHPMYKKRVKRSKKYLVHAEKPVTVGQTVTFQETRPLSKRKCWILVPNSKPQTLNPKQIKNSKPKKTKV